MPDDKTDEQKQEEQKAELEKLETQVSEKKTELEQLEADRTKAKEEGKTETDAEVSKRDAVKKEHDRLLADVTKIREERRTAQDKDASFQERFKREQFQKARDRFFKEFPYEDEAKKDELLANFEKYDDGSLDAENVYRALKKAHVSLNPDAYIAMERRIKRAEEAAKEHNADSSGSGFDGEGSLPEGGFEDLTPEDIKAAQWAGIPLEKYRELKKAGKV